MRAGISVHRMSVEEKYVRLDLYLAKAVVSGAVGIRENGSERLLSNGVDGRRCRGAWRDIGIRGNGRSNREGGRAPGSNMASAA